MAMKCGDVKRAEHVYNLIKNKDFITNGLMTNEYVENHIPEKALDIFEQMHLDPNNTMHVNIICACTPLADDRAKSIGKKLLEQMPNNIRNNGIVLTSAIHMLMKFGDVKRAEQVFELIKKKDIVSDGAMIHGYFENHIPQKALDLFEQMRLNPVHSTYTIVFSACAQLADDRAKSIGKKLLEQMPNNFRNNNIILNSAIHMLMKFGDITYAEQIFEMSNKNIVTYGAIMKGYIEKNMNEKALDLFEQMPFNPNDIVYTIIFNACAQFADDRAK